MLNFALVVPTGVKNESTAGRKETKEGGVRGNANKGRGELKRLRKSRAMSQI